MKLKRNILLLIVAFIVIVLFFVLLDLFDIRKIIPLTTSYDWLGFMGAFLGSMIGGLITYLGVYLTLKYQENADNEKNRLSIIPILEYKLSYDKSDFDNSQGQLAGEVISHINIENAKCDDKKSLEWHFDLKVSNIGLGHAQITNVKFIIGDNQKNFIQEENLGYSYKLVKMNDTQDLRFLFYAPKSRFKYNHISGKEFIYTIDIIIYYQDLLGNKYQQKVYCCITQSTLKIDKKIVNKWCTADLFYYDNFLKIDN